MRKVIIKVKGAVLKSEETIDLYKSIINELNRTGLIILDEKFDVFVLEDDDTVKVDIPTEE
jgi:hypothetical protein